MTKDGRENRYGKFIFEESQADRITAGDFSVISEFIEDNFGFLYNWARKFIRNFLYFLPDDMYGSFYKPEEMINQIYVDFPLYNLESEKTLFNGVGRSFRGITCGGFQCHWKSRQNQEMSLEAPFNVSERSGEKADGNTLKDLLPSRDPRPDSILERKEHVREIAPRYYHEIGKLFGKDKPAKSGGATIGEILAEKNGLETSGNPFQDVIEEVFFGYTFKEIKAYAKRAV